MAAVAAPYPSPLNQPPRVHGRGEEDEEEEYAESVKAEMAVPTSVEDLYASYLGISFAVLLSFLPKSALSLIPTLQCRNHYLSLRLHQAEEQLQQLRSRRQEDSKANARVVEIFASHRNAWQREERRLIQEIDESCEEISKLRERVSELERNESALLGDIDELKRELGERDELLNFMSRKMTSSEEGLEETGLIGSGGEGEYFNGGVGEGGVFVDDEGGDFSSAGGHRDGRDIAVMFEHSNGGFDPNFLSSGASKFWAERANLWQDDVRYESCESMYHMKHFVARRESPWKVDGESTSVPSKLKLLEQELSNLERIGKGEFSKVPSLMRKQAKRYQDLAGKIDDLCQRMQASDPCESTLSTEFRTQRQTEFLLEAVRLQQRAVETGHKLATLKNEISSSGYDLESHTKLVNRRSMETIKSNFKEIQRNLEIWLARIIGDLKGILARDGASRVREYYISSCGYA